MDRLEQLRGTAGGSKNSTLDTTSPASESFLTANESTSKYFSLSEDDSTFDMSSMKDDNLASTTSSEPTITNNDDLISNLSPIAIKGDVDSYKIGKQIEAANILSGGVDIFDDNDNSYDGNDLVIDDNVEMDDKLNSELKLTDTVDDNIEEATLIDEGDIASKDTEVVLQIDGKNVDAIDIGNGLYLYRKQGKEELAAVQIIDDDQSTGQPSFKFLKVRENAEGNLEVYEEIEIEVPKEVPAKETKLAGNTSHVPIKDINKAINDSSSKVMENKHKSPQKETVASKSEPDNISNKDTLTDKTDTNFNGKAMIFCESRKSPVIGSFTPMTYHSTPNKEGKPLTKTMVDLQLHPNRHSDNVKKTIEVHTDHVKSRLTEPQIKNKEVLEINKVVESISTPKRMKFENIRENDLEGSAKIDCIKERKKLDTNTKIDKTKDNEKALKENIKIDNIKESIKELEVIAETDKTKENKKEVDENTTADTTKEKDKALVENIKIDNIKENNMELEAITKTDTTNENDMALEENIKTKENKKELEAITKTDTLCRNNKTFEENIKLMNLKESNKELEALTKPDTTQKNDKTEENFKIDNIKENKKESEAITKIHKTKENEKELEENIKIDLIKENISECKVIDETQVHHDKNLCKKSNSKFQKAEVRLPDLEERCEVVLNVETQCGKDFPSVKLTEGITVIDTNVSNESDLDTQDCKNKTSAQSQIDDKNIIEKCYAIPKGNKGNEESVKDNTTKRSNDNLKIELNTYEIPKTSGKPYIKNYTQTSKTEVNSLISDQMVGDVLLSDTHQISSSNIVPIHKTKLDKCKEELISIAKTSSTVAKINEDVILSLEKPMPNQDVESKLRLSPENILTSHKPTTVDQKHATIHNICEKHINENVQQKKQNDPKNELSDKHTEKLSQAQCFQNYISKDETSVLDNNDTSGNTKNEHTKIITKNYNISHVIKTDQTLNVSKKEQNSNVTKEEPIVSTSNIEPLKSNITVKETNIVRQDQFEQKKIVAPSASHSNAETKDKKEALKSIVTSESKPINIIKSAVPFGKWTEANRQEFLNKIKETKIPINSSNSKQIKNSNDLNRRDVLKKIDSQRQSNNTKAQERQKQNIKNETVFSNKPNVGQEIKNPVKKETHETKSKPLITTKSSKPKQERKASSESSNSSTIAKNESSQRKDVNTTQYIIERTIEGIMHRTLPNKLVQEVTKPNVSKQGTESKNKVDKQTDQQPTSETPTTLDAIEMKMNELHGIPFIERPPHELPQVSKSDINQLKIEKEVKKANIVPQIPKLLPYSNKTQRKRNDNVIEIDSDDEVIEHEPITGDIDINKVTMTSKSQSNIVEKANQESPKKDAIITEKDFDKFARRNSFTYENCLTVNYAGKEPVIHTVKQKDTVLNHTARNNPLKTEIKIRSSTKQVLHQNIPFKIKNISKTGVVSEDTNNKYCSSKLQMAYQSALTTKRQLECPITIIEDKPVKVVFMDSNTEYNPLQLNVQGQELSPAKKLLESDACTVSTADSFDTDFFDDSKSPDNSKIKIKHQRKQVLTPVELPDLELVQPSDLGIEVSPKKKRKMEYKIEKSPKTLVHKKSYLLGRSSTAVEKFDNTEIKASKDDIIQTEAVIPNDTNTATVSAIDNLVKAAELLDNQSKIMDISSNTIQSNTPVKRGRGRPRKYPLPEGTLDKPKVPSPQKKPRIQRNSKVRESVFSTDEDTSTDEELIRENWTMGKINENIVCPICNKLFRSENVVFKHVKHCTGPSPSRSDSDKRSPKRFRQLQDFDSKSFDSKSDEIDIDNEPPVITEKKNTPNKRKSKDSSEKPENDVIVIEDTPLKTKMKKTDEHITKHEPKKKDKLNLKQQQKNNLVCEFCGKTFRQLSYLVSHKLQHKKENLKNTEKVTSNSVFSCEICKKEFRKLHHLVQHRIIHNPNSMPSKLTRKSSLEQNEHKPLKDPKVEDLSAGFRCEPCDKSFRKLHHLVEHRETHDGINRQKNNMVTQSAVESSHAPPQCNICNKTFRKLQHLVEHREQHMETGSEKSDDKSVKSALSTRDIIHECSLCYMVFPNEHSLNRHFIICLRKKKQSKQSKPVKENVEDENTNSGEAIIDDCEKSEVILQEEKAVAIADDSSAESKSIETVPEIVDNIPKLTEDIKSMENDESPTKIEEVQDKATPQPVDAIKIKEKTSEKRDKASVNVEELPKNNNCLLVKDNFTPLTKRQTTSNLPLSKTHDIKPIVETSDDDEVRYMLNPNFKVDETSEGKQFMKVRAKKRNSLQIERPSSKDLLKRRISLQHPPKVHRLKPKLIESKTPSKILKSAKSPKLEPVPSTDSDDSDVKYSFPKTAPEKSHKDTQDSQSENNQRKHRKSISEKRKSLSMIAKRKSLAKPIIARNKVKQSPVKQIKRRTVEAEHRCDCGQLFSSAALLSRHTTLAHTPPRIRRRRSPPPDIDTKIISKPPRKSNVQSKNLQNVSRKSTVRSDSPNTNAKPNSQTRKSSSTKTETKPLETRKSKAAEKVDLKTGTSREIPRRTAAHRGVPVPEKMRKLMMKNKS